MYTDINQDWGNLRRLYDRSMDVSGNIQEQINVERAVSIGELDINSAIERIRIIDQLNRLRADRNEPLKTGPYIPKTKKGKSSDTLKKFYG